MPAKCSDIFRLIEEMAPLNLAESWDNSGLQVGDPRVEVEKVLLTLDVDIRVAREAKTRGCRLIVSHHPLLFKPAGSIRFDRPAGELIAYLVKNDLQVYAAHTNLDNAAGGVSKALAEELGLKKQAVLNQSGRERLLKLAVFVPLEHCEAVRNAMSEAGAGWIGNYSHCTFLTRGTGTFKPLQGTNPYIGKTGVVEHVDEIKIETVVPASRLEPVLQAMLEAHPYEEVAYDLYGLVLLGVLLGRPEGLIGAVAGRKV
jgi:dinuclear metal center YbgI/SA1388 family protein